MVQYIHTPWRDQAELLKVRRQFYPSPSPTNATTGTTTTTPTIELQNEKEQRHAVSRVAMWMQRGSCPHMVESTGLLIAAILDDLDETRTKSNSSSATRLAYSAAFSREFACRYIMKPHVQTRPELRFHAAGHFEAFINFAREAHAYLSVPCHHESSWAQESFVTGLLDSHQDKLQKQSMYSIAKTIGLPATFVELRHQCTHEQLPSLLKLRSAAHKSLAWIWDYYWRPLGEDEAHDLDNVTGIEVCQEQLLAYLGSDDVARRKALETRLIQWDDGMILQALSDIGDCAENTRILLRSLQMSRQILEGKESDAKSEKDSDLKIKDLEVVAADISRVTSELEAMEKVQQVKIVENSNSNVSLEPTMGWSRYQGSWKPKPIGAF